MYNNTNQSTAILDTMVATVNKVDVWQYLYQSNHQDEIIEIKKFWIEKHYCNVTPPLRFLYEFDCDSDLIYVYGTGIYDDILAYGETFIDARNMLENEIIPFLWAEYVQEDDSFLSEKARMIKEDLEGRIEE